MSLAAALLIKHAILTECLGALAAPIEQLGSLQHQTQCIGWKVEVGIVCQEWTKQYCQDLSEGSQEAQDALQLMRDATKVRTH